VKRRSSTTAIRLLACGSSNSLLAAILGSLLILCSPAGAWGYTPRPGSPLADDEHPRLFVNAATLPDVVSKCTGPMAEIYAVLKGKADYVAGQTGTPDPGTWWRYVESNVPTLCFVGMIERELGHDPSPYFSRAIDYLEAIYGQSAGLPGGHSGYPFEAGILAFAVAYDWMYPDLTPAQRQRYAAELLRYYDQAWATRGTGEMSDRPFNNRYNLTLGALTYGAAAVYGAGIDPAKEQAFLDWAVASLGYIRSAINTSGAGGGGWHEGWAYALHEAMFASARIMAAWESASGESVFADSALSGWGLWSVYLTRPMDGRRAHLDEWNLSRDDGKWVHPDYPYKGNREFYALLGARYADGFAQWIADQSTSVSDWIPSDYNHAAVWDLLFTDTSVAATAPSNALPLSRHFVGQGTLVMRSGFESPDDTFAVFRARDWYAGHQHRDVNSFIIHKGADLAIETGIYSGWSTDHRRHYFQSSLAHNTVLVYDPTDCVADINDGGQIPKGNRDHRYITPVPGAFYDIADMVVEITDTYDYAQGDGTRAYDPGNVTNFERTFIRFKPQDWFVVFDRVSSTDASLQKKWLLHMVQEPQVSEPGQILSVEVPGHIMTVRGNRIAFENRGWAMDVQIVLPAGAIVRKAGGPGYRYWVDDNGYNGPQGGANWPPPTSSYGGHTPEELGVGGWRVEVMPPTAAIDDLFLNVLQVGAAGFAVAPATLIDAGPAGPIGVIIEGASDRRAAVFSRSGQALSEGRFEIPSGSAAEVLLCDLEPSRLYWLQLGTEPLTSFTSSEAGTHLFVCPGGSTVVLLSSLPGDVDSDDDVDVFDVIALIQAFGSRPGDPNWDPRCDFDGNGRVDVLDVIAVVNNFGTTA